MKLTDVVHKTVPLKKFTNYKKLDYRYKVLRVPALSDSVVSKAMPPQPAVCVNEMSRMMDCWKRTDFSHTACSEEIGIFMNCVAQAKVEMKKDQELFARGLPSKGSKMRPSKAVNEMLARYPQPLTNFKNSRFSQ